MMCRNINTSFSQIRMAYKRIYFFVLCLTLIFRFIYATIGGLEQSGLVPTAPSYADCYLNGCVSTYSCTDTSQCAPGSCCMPTSWAFYGNYCVSLAQLDNLNQYARRKCLCRKAEPTKAGASAGDTAVSEKQVTVIAGEEEEEEDEGNTDGTDGIGSSSPAQQQQTQSGASMQTTTQPQQQQQQQAQHQQQQLQPPPSAACNGCMFDGKCIATGTAWVRRDGCTRCYCKNTSGTSGDYRCTDSQCSTDTTASAEEETSEGDAEATQESVQVEPQVANGQEVQPGESEQGVDAANVEVPSPQQTDNDIPSSQETQPEPGVESPQPAECTGCTVNGQCVQTGAQWVLTEGGCSRRCVCFNPNQSGTYRCAPCPQDFVASSPAVPVSELNKGISGNASSSAEATAYIGVGEDDGGG